MTRDDEETYEPSPNTSEGAATFSASLVLTPSIAANAAISALGERKDAEANSRRSLWTTVAYMPDRELRDEHIRLSAPGEMPGSRYGSLGREQVLSAIQLRMQELKEKRDGRKMLWLGVGATVVGGLILTGIAWAGSYFGPGMIGP